MASRSRAPQRTLITQAQAAEYLGVTDRTIRAYIATGRLTAYRLGPKLVRIDASEVEALLNPITTAGGAA